MKVMHQIAQAHLFNVNKSILSLVSRVIFSAFVVLLSYSSYANDSEKGEAGRECKFRMELYTMEGNLYSVQEAMKEDDLSIKNIKAGQYKMVIRDGSKVIFNARVTVPAEEKQIAEK